MPKPPSEGSSRSNARAEAFARYSQMPVRASPARLRRIIWGLALLAECAARLVGAYTLPVATMAWLGTVITIGAIGVAVVVGGVAAGPMQRLVTAEAARPAAA